MMYDIFSILCMVQLVISNMVHKPIVSFIYGLKL